MSKDMREFSDSLVYKVKCSSGNSYSRIELLTNMVKDKVVLHVGCCDHYDLIQDKISNGIWLHAELMKTANNVIGIDVNSKAVSLVNNLGFTNVYNVGVFDFEKVNKILSNKIDIILIPEVIEHIPNPVEWLSMIATLYKGIAEQLIITTPNAYSIGNLLNSLQRREVINSDHKHVFTPYTLNLLLQESGLNENQIGFTDGDFQFNLGGLLRSATRIIFPYSLPTLYSRSDLKKK